MALMRQTQQQKLLQKLSPQQIQLMKLLQLPTVNLEERIKEEIEENPALEYAENQDEADPIREALEEDYAEEASDAEPDAEPELDLSEYINDEDDSPDYMDRADPGRDPDQDEPRSAPVRAERSFHEDLLSQLGMLELSERETQVASQIIGSIDDDGYLRREPQAIVDDLAFAQNIQTDEEEVRQLIGIIQGFDPPGVCAVDLRECLLLQLARKPQDDPAVRHATGMLERYFEEFSKKHYDKIRRGLNLSEEELRDAIRVVTHLNPKPGGSFEPLNKAESYVVPDFYVSNTNGRLELSLNGRNAPDLRISPEYRDMMREYDRGDKKDKQRKEAVLFIKQKIDAAKWFIDAIKQRQHTLLSTMQTILNYQEEFFLTGDETALKPMILKDIADRTGLDISTVSRVANSKFVQTEFGTYKLKYFFSESLSTDSGEEVSTREVKKILQDLVGAENKRKPLSDEHLTQKLQDKGYNIARRTVAKYREQLNIPVARLRKEL